LFLDTLKRLILYGIQERQYFWGQCDGGKKKKQFLGACFPRKALYGPKTGHCDDKENLSLCGEF
jgi:hypothetical protein